MARGPLPKLRRSLLKRALRLEVGCLLQATLPFGPNVRQLILTLLAELQRLALVRPRQLQQGLLRPSLQQAKPFKCQPLPY